MPEAQTATAFQRFFPFGLGSLLLCFYCLALLFPIPWWGLHHLAFWSLGWQLLFLIGAVGLQIWGWRSLHQNPPSPKGWDRKLPFWVLLVFPLLAGLLFYQFPMAEPVYGDAALFQEKLGDRTLEYQGSYFEKLLSPNVFSPKNGNLTVLSATRLLSWKAGCTHQQAFRLIGCFCGISFVLLWLYFVRQQVPDLRLQLLLGLVGVTAPFTQFFYGYEEIYAPGFVAFLAFSMALVRCLQQPGWYRLVGLTALLWLALKTHSAAFIFLPAYGLAWWHFIATKKPQLRSFLSWKWVLIGIGLPVLLGGAVIYFFVLESYRDPRFLNLQVDIYERLFLPLLSPEAPLDRYTLLSFWHFWDVGQLISQWSLAAWFLLAVMAFSFRKQLRVHEVPVIALGFTLFLYLLLFFMVNPLMSMPIDADYFSLPGPVLLVLTLLLVRQISASLLLQRASSGVLVLCLLALPIGLTNASPEPLGKRLESLGQHIFNSYWIRSIANVETGIQLQGLPPEEQLKHYEEVARAIEPLALPEKDHEYATLWQKMGRLNRDSLKNYKLALTFHKRANYYAPNLAANYIGLMDASYQLGQFDSAYHYSERLIELNHPSPTKALRIALQCAIMSGQRLEALKVCEAYLLLDPAEDVRTMRTELAKGTDLATLQRVYQR